MLLIGFSVALFGIIVLLVMLGFQMRRIDRKLSEIEELLSADDERDDAPDPTTKRPT
jgi:hypothetical protein